VHTFVCMCIHVCCAHVYMHVCVHVCAYVYVCVCTCTCGVEGVIFHFLPYITHAYVNLLNTKWSRLLGDAPLDMLALYFRHEAVVK
jgi:hypothetical protein